MEKSKVKIQTIMFMFMIVAVFFGNEVMAQDLDLEAADEQIESGFDIFLKWLDRTLTVIMGIGVVSVAYAYAFNSQGAKEHLMKFIIAILVGAVGKALFLVTS